jgi:DNA-binding NtrC family response regulator
MNNRSILVLSNDAHLRYAAKAQLENAGYQVIAASEEQFKMQTRGYQPKLVITDLRAQEANPTDWFKELRGIYPDAALMVTVDGRNLEDARKAIRAGLYDCVPKPIDYQALVLATHRAMERQALREEIQELRVALDGSYGFECITGRSRRMLHVLEMAARAAQHDSTVLILGETGTGKTLLARTIHQNSSRRYKPFISITCDASARELMHDDLFGIAQGILAKASFAEPSKAQKAAGGTLFLRGIEELPADLQFKLLCSLRSSNTDGHPGMQQFPREDLRIIVAADQSLQSLKENGCFREDLYYRLAVVPLELPPLRERKEDIPELTQRLLQQLKQRHGLPALRISPALINYFHAYSWPGNVRELENVIERMIVLSAGDELTIADLPVEIRTALPAQIDLLRLQLPDCPVSLEGVERELLVQALERFHGNQSKAARYLSISRRTLIYRMKKYRLHGEAERKGNAI